MPEHDKWLVIAREDLGMARLAMSAEYFSSATYHCQQCAEKSLKGYLSFRSDSIIKTHDLVKLLEQCMLFDRDFQKLYPSVRILNPFSTKFRYPTEFDVPDQDKTMQAIQYAENVLKFVADKITDPISDQLQIR